MIPSQTILDLVLLIYTAVLTYYIIGKRRKNQTHKIDRYFPLTLIPYIILISLTSATIAAQEPIAISFLITTGALTSLTFTITRVKNQKKAYITETVIGLTALTVFFTQIKTGFNGNIFLRITGLAVAAFTPVYIIHLILERKKTGLYLFPVLTHFLDAGSTVVALEEGLMESRTLAQIFISSMGEYGIFVMKALTIIPIALYIEEKIEGEISREVLFMIGVYGLVLGLRNYFLVIS